MAASEDRENYRYNAVPDGVEGTRQYVARALAQQEQGARIPFTIVWKGRVVGTTSLSDFHIWEWPRDARPRSALPDVAEIGYTWLAASAQRTGCNTEAKYLLLRHAFEVWQVFRVCLRTDVRNARSRAAIERLGAKLDGIRRADVPGQDGLPRDSIFYSIVADEWPAVRVRLRERMR